MIIYNDKLSFQLENDDIDYCTFTYPYFYDDNNNKILSGNPNSLILKTKNRLVNHDKPIEGIDNTNTYFNLNLSHIGLIIQSSIMVNNENGFYHLSLLNTKTTDTHEYKSYNLRKYFSMPVVKFIDKNSFSKFKLSLVY